MTNPKKTYVLVPEDTILNKNQRRRRNRHRNRFINDTDANYGSRNDHPAHNVHNNNSNNLPSFQKYQEMMYQKYIDTYLDNDTPPYKNNSLANNPYYINEINNPTNLSNSNNHISSDNKYYYDDPYSSISENVKLTIDRPSNNLYTNSNIIKPQLKRSTPISVTMAASTSSSTQSSTPTYTQSSTPTYTQSSTPTYTTPSSRSTYLDSLYDYEKSLEDIKKKYGLNTSTSDKSWKERYKDINDELDEITIRQTELLNELQNKNFNKTLTDDLYNTSPTDKDGLNEEPPIYYTTFGTYKKKKDNDKDDTQETNETDGTNDDVSDDHNSIPPSNGGEFKKELCFCLPLDNSGMKKPDSTDGLLQMLFPSLKSKDNTETKEEDEINLRRDRSEYIKGEPIDMEISTLDDLINLANKIGTDYSLETTYSLDLASLQIMKPSLEKLNNMVGLLDIKKRIVHQIIFYLQGLDDTNKDMLHTVIEGDPGVGKTEIAKILGEIYGSLGILSKGTFKSVKRADLIGSYLGQTATKTLKVLEAAKGGVLFIDEAYSLGNEEGKDIYSKECIDTITAFLSENREDFVCIIAGYRDALRQCFFKYNAGLERRFPWTYTITSYTHEELKLIFEMC